MVVVYFKPACILCVAMILKNITVFVLIVVLCCAGVYVQQHTVKIDKVKPVFQLEAPPQTNTTQSPVRMDVPPVSRVSVFFCVPVKSTASMHTLRDTELVNTLIPSIVKSIIPRELGTSFLKRTQTVLLTPFSEIYELHMLLGFNDDDAFWLERAKSLKQHKPNFLHISYAFMPLPIVVREGRSVTSMINITNTLVQNAYSKGAEYIVRVNDDTEFVSKGWLTKAIQTLRSYNPPNVGVVGPLCRQGNTGILTHDLIHRMHMEIFETYWPTYFVNWYGDTWITDVYRKVDRLTVLQAWEVKHNVNRHGTRYDPFSPPQSKYDLLVNIGASRIAKYLKTDCSATCSVEPLLKKVIAYSLYGTNPRYTNVVSRVVENAKRVYPGWTVRIFVPADFNTAPLKELNVDVCVVQGSKCPSPMWYRMYFLNDLPADYTLVRDIDSLLTMRESRAVKKWVDSGLDMHVMRDAKSGHDVAINGGMFGVRKTANVNWRAILDTYKDKRDYGADLDVLANAIFDRAVPKAHILQHDSHTCVKWGAQPFPDNDLDDGVHYVGEAVRDDGRNHYFPDASLKTVWDPPAECSLSTFVAFTSTRPVHMLKQKEIQDQVAYIKSMEKDLWDYMTKSLPQICKLPNAVFVDSGANEGTWSLMAASYGCQVVAVEPQPLCVHWLRQEVKLNQMQDRIRVHNNVLSNSKFSVAVNDNACSGTSQYKSDGTVVDAFDTKIVKLKTQNVNAVQLSELISDEAVVIRWHLDTEGAEIPVLQSAKPLLERNRICEIILEWLPAQWSKFNVTVQAGVETAHTLLQNFVCTNGCNKVADFSLKQGGGSLCDSHRDMFCTLKHSLPSKCHV